MLREKRQTDSPFLSPSKRIDKEKKIYAFGRSEEVKSIATSTRSKSCACQSEAEAERVGA